MHTWLLPVGQAQALVLPRPPFLPEEPHCPNIKHCMPQTRESLAPAGTQSYRTQGPASLFPPGPVATPELLRPTRKVHVLRSRTAAFRHHLLQEAFPDSPPLQTAGGALLRGPEVRKLSESQLTPEWGDQFLWFAWNCPGFSTKSPASQETPQSYADLRAGPLTSESPF